MAVSSKILGPIRRQIRDSAKGFLHADGYTSAMCTFSSNLFAPDTVDIGNVAAVSFYFFSTSSSAEAIIRLNNTDSISVSETAVTSVDGADTIYINGYERNDQTLIADQPVHVTIVFDTIVDATNFAIGGDGSTSFSGRASNITLFSYTLAADQAERLYRNPNHCTKISGLKAYYILNGAQGGIIYDYSLSARHITFSGTRAGYYGQKTTFQTYTQPHNQAVYFQEADYFGLGTIAATSNDFFSASVWFYPFEEKAQELFTIGDLKVALSNNYTLNFVTTTENESVLVDGMAGNLNHLVVTTDDAADEAKIYFNGKLFKTITSLNIDSGTAASYIAFTGGFGTEFGGYIYEVATWERILASDEIDKIWNNVGEFDLREDYNDYDSTDLKLYIKTTDGDADLFNRVDFTTYSLTAGTGTIVNLFSTDTNNNPKDVNGFPVNHRNILAAGNNETAIAEITMLELRPSGLVHTLSAFSISAWVKIYRVNTGDTGVIMDKRDHYYFEVSNAYELSVGVYNGASMTVSTTASAGLTRYKWHHLTAVYDGSDVLFYIDGELNETVSSAAISANGADSQLTTAARLIDNAGTLERDDNLMGLIDDVMFYTSAISAADVSQNYNTTKDAHFDGD